MDPRALETARRIIDDVRRRGDDAVLEAAAQFDRGGVTLRNLRVQPAEFEAARRRVDAPFKRAARRVRRRVIDFARAGMKKDWRKPTAGGGFTGEQFVPLERIGLYIPAGKAPLVSTVLMTAPLAEAAGVPSVCACSPPGPDGGIDPYMLVALDLCGVREVYKLGGIQAIAAMACGTKTIRRVRKIAGPGGPYVTAAKKLVYGDTGIDLVAGPSEIAVLADASADAPHVAADLLSQAEHGTGAEKTLLVTTSAKLAEAVRSELIRQTPELSRAGVIRTVLERGTLLVVVPRLEDGIDLCNRFAPEHMELIVRNPSKWIKKIRNAGALFIGPWTPESVGDFAAGPSHVLPTGGTASIFSGLTVEDFRRRVSLIRYTKKDLADDLDIIEAMGRVETLDAHTRSAQRRFES